MNTFNNVTSSIAYLITILGLLFNFLLIWLIKTKTPKEMLDFRWLLLNIAISDILLAFSFAFVNGRVLIVDASVVLIIFGKVIYFEIKIYIYSGPSQYVPKYLSRIFLGLVDALTLYNSLSLTIMFIYRYILICTNHSYLLSMKNTLKSIAINVAIMLICFIIASIASVSPTDSFRFVTIF